MISTEFKDVSLWPIKAKFNIKVSKFIAFTWKTIIQVSIKIYRIIQF